MPRIKPSPEEDRNRIIRAIIVGNQERYAISDESIAKYLHMSLATFKKKKVRPVQAASIALGRNITAKEVKDFILM